MNSNGNKREKFPVLTVAELDRVVGGVEWIEKGDEFLTIWDQIEQHVRDHMILYDPYGVGWNSVPR